MEKKYNLIGENISFKVGDLDQKITLETYSKTRNSFGEVVKNYSVIASVWAKVEEEMSKEDDSNDRQVLTRKIRVTIRWRESLNNTDRMLWDSVYWDVKGIHRVGRKHLLVLMAENYG